MNNKTHNGPVKCRFIKESIGNADVVVGQKTEQVSIRFCMKPPEEIAAAFEGEN